MACTQTSVSETASPTAATIATAIPTDVPIIEATATDAPTAVAVATPDTPTPVPTLVDETLPSATSASVSTPDDSTPVNTPVSVVSTAHQKIIRPTTPNPGSAPPAPVGPHPDAPVQLVIPKIGVRASVESVGVDRTGAMAAPSGPYTVGWWAAGTLPGDPGNAVIDGHLDSARVGAAVFWRLGDLRAGDQIQLRMPGNRTLTFIVDHTAIYPFDNAPLADIFGSTDTPSLNLVTCTGFFDRSSKNYDRRLVVYSKLQK